MWTLCSHTSPSRTARVAVLDLRLAVAQRLDLGAGQHHPGLPACRAGCSGSCAWRLRGDVARRHLRLPLLAIRLELTRRARGRRGRAGRRRARPAPSTGSPSRIALPDSRADEHRLELVELPPVAAQAAHRQQALVAVAERDERAGADHADDLAARTRGPSRPRRARARAGSSARRRRRRARSTIASRSRVRAPVAGRLELRRPRRLLPAADGGQQRAVADEVRVAADRRREVAVARRAQAGVAEVLRRVARLLERAQHERRRGRARPCPVRRTCSSTSREISPTSSAACCGDIVLGQRRRRRRRATASCATRRSTARGLRALVDAVERRHLAAAPAARRPPRWRAIIRCSISRCDSVCLARRERRHVALAREVELRLDATRSPAPRARSRASSSAAATRARRLQRLRPRRLGALGAGEDAVDLRVVEARVGADQRAVERGPRRRARPRSPSRPSRRAGPRSARASRRRFDSASGSIGSTAPGT